ncbi:hypothetical protein K461DRAFT_137930 [Myriangium duriaei CBS 260.36]|uniref:SAP domain-containing protein n=1 Tax=Myriangium duriaei CBS 260.36 TaxID=1168546 RepID=A0A9P4J140_9PEZI|nr:hypothetical protein K461DRAFT_137930 [Myriangium duriaei CBS 260.36]
MRETSRTDTRGTIMRFAPIDQAEGMDLDSQAMPPPPLPTSGRSQANLRPAGFQLSRAPAASGAMPQRNGGPFRPSGPLPSYAPNPAYMMADDPNTDPREIMSRSELLSLIVERGMTKNREKETKTLLNRRIRQSDHNASMVEIQNWLFKRGLSTAGNRAEKLWRLVEYDATRSRSWRPKHMATLTRGRQAVQHLFSGAGDSQRQGSVMLPRPSSVIGADVAAGRLQGVDPAMLGFAHDGEHDGGHGGGIGQEDFGLAGDSQVGADRV